VRTPKHAMPKKTHRVKAEAAEELPRVTLKALAGATAVVTGLAALVGYTGCLVSPAEGRTSFPVRFIFFLLFESVYGPLTTALILPLTRVVARHLPAAILPEQGAYFWEMSSAEQAQHDSSLAWPLSTNGLPDDWVRFVLERKKEAPFFLNHVRGSARCIHAGARVGVALGSICTVVALSLLLDNRPFCSLGQCFEAPQLGEMLIGFVTGAGIIGLTWLAEIRLGWLKVFGYFEVAAPGESFSLNLLIDCVFHAAVTINEELSLRGWLLLNAAEACHAHFDTSAFPSLAIAMITEALLFSALHAGSPGASRIGLMNLTLGGIAAGCNVLLSGGLAFSFGWHFGWNITMGNLLGMSTSGIPISATLVSVVPHPDKAALHGGTFGPEQSPLAPAAYLLGGCVLVAVYGLDQWAGLASFAVEGSAIPSSST